jgi:hypothetical protein
MANIVNAFDALSQIGRGEAAPASKKKKAKKPKAQVAQEDAGAAAPAEQEAVIDFQEACAVLDKTARTFKSGGDRLKLWKDWIKQVGRGEGRGPARG